MNILSKSNKLPEQIFLGLEKDSKASYRATTNGTEITVLPEFVSRQNSAIGDLFIWAYHVRIEHQNSENIQLLNRHWKIIDEDGVKREVEGEGVIGQQPKITPNNSFQYSSGVHLARPSGIMKGHYEMQRENGEKFQVEIPTFSLDSPALQKSIN